MKSTAVLPILVGAVLGALFAAFARSRKAAEVRVLALGLTVVALIYVGLALAGTARDWLLVEMAGVALFGGLAWLGLRASRWWLAVGWVAHVAWDVGLHLGPAQAVVGGWYPLLCVGFDLVVAGFVLSAALKFKEAEMREQTVLGLAVLFLLLSCARDGGNTDGPWGDKPIPKSAADLQWVDLDPAGAPGAKIAKLWGDPAKGGFGAFFMLPAGFAVPLHTHTHPMKVVIVSGTYIQAPGGAPEFRLGPSSYLMQPGGDYRHTTSCAMASPCVFFVESEGAFDLHPVAESARSPN
jgi:hypothetical protein